MTETKVLLLGATDHEKFDFYRKLKQAADISFVNKAAGFTEDDIVAMIGPFAAIMIISRQAITARVIFRVLLGFNDL